MGLGPLNPLETRIEPVWEHENPLSSSFDLEQGSSSFRYGILTTAYNLKSGLQLYDWRWCSSLVSELCEPLCSKAFDRDNIFSREGIAKSSLSIHINRIEASRKTNLPFTSFKSLWHYSFAYLGGIRNIPWHMCGSQGTIWGHWFLLSTEPYLKSLGLALTTFRTLELPFLSVQVTYSIIPSQTVIPHYSTLYL